MFPGPSAIINGTVGLSLSALFIIYNIVRPEGLSRRAGQLGTACLCTLTVVGQIMLAAFWRVGQDNKSFPIVLTALTIGNAVATGTYFIVFPLITMHYGGWLIAPFRSGTDLGGTFATLLGTAEAPQGGGGPHLYPISSLYYGLGALAFAGTVTWIYIVYSGLGLRDAGALKPYDCVIDNAEESTSDSSSDCADEEMVTGKDNGRCGKMKSILRGFSCPRSLVLPVVVATVSQVNYWTIGANLYIVASQMLNAPGDCDGHFGSRALRFATTLNFTLVPIGSILSSIGSCPRPVFYGIFIIQSLSALSLVLCCFGAGREAFWMTEFGRVVYIVSYGLVGMLEGFLLTMAYRYCGDDAGVTSEERTSASSLLSLLGVVLVNIPNIFFGILLDDKSIACH
eukprot:TRINITY_DN27115_c0_g1_i1.p1 TRINITY_DN27115_c0_g1~~TRINITY_DN27115_c0_g1_i1.p1  ORF type:complete len:462 (+),score=48.21 TRINITY_DN27115_c0_g1_i1:197-1387(+)